MFSERMGFYMAELDALHDYVMITIVAIAYLLFVLLARLIMSKFI